MENNTNLQYTYYRLPKALFSTSAYNQLSPLAKLLYAILLDRMCLSEAHGDEWKDQSGNIYIYFKISEIAAVLTCSQDTASRLLLELENASLLVRRRQGQGKPNKLFVQPLDSFKTFDKKTVFSATAPLKPRVLKAEISDSNNIYLDNKVNNNYLHLSRSEAESYVKEIISYYVIRTEFNKSQIDSVVDVMVDVFAGISPYIYVAGEQVSRHEVQQQLSLLDEMRIRYVCDRIRTEPRRIANHRGYILARLCDSANIVDLFYQSQVEYDYREN